MFYIDESGSIPKHLSTKHANRYFVVSFVHTSDKDKLKRVYRNSIRNLKKYFPHFFSTLSNVNEMKGSEALPFMKMYIFEQLILKTDIKIAHMVVDNWIINNQFRTNPGRSFNYLVKVVMENFPLSAQDKQKLILRIDNRNSAIESLKSLEDYLYQELVLHCQLTQDVDVQYVESQNNYGVQIADVVANTIYQSYRYDTLPFPSFSDIPQSAQLIYPETYRALLKQLRPIIAIPYTYPPYSGAASAAATTSHRNGVLGKNTH